MERGTAGKPWWRSPWRSAAAVAIKVPELFGVRMQIDRDLPAFYLRNLSLFVLPFLAVFFA